MQTASDGPAAAARPTGALLERERELRALDALVGAAAEGRGGAAVVVGPAGIGKTSLLAAARASAGALGLRCLTARGGELERDFPYGVVRQLLEREVAGLPAAVREAMLAGAAAPARRVVAGEAGGHDAEAPFAVTHALHWLCANLAQQGSLLVIVDDLHWADAASATFLAYLVRRVEEVPVAVLAGCRPAADPAAGALLDRLLAEPHVARIEPAPLTSDAVGRLLGDAGAVTAGPALAEACHAATAGNPYLCRALAGALAHEDLAEGDDLASRVTALAAHASSEEVLRRIGALPSRGEVLARALAVLGADAELRHAARLARLDEPDAATAADALAAQGILRTGATLDFVHPLVRAAVRDRMPALARGLLHRRAARVLADDGVAPERYAAHLLAAPPNGQAWVVDALRAAARVVHGQGAPAAAASYLRRALDEPPGDAQRRDVLFELGVAELHAGDAGAAAGHLEAVHDAVEPQDRPAVARHLAAALMTLGRYADGVTVLERAIAGLGEDERDLALGLEAELHQTAMMDPSTYARAKDRLPALDRDVAGDTPGERAYLAVLCTESCLRSDAAHRVRAWAQRAVDRGLLDGQDPSSAVWVNVAFPLVIADGFDLAEALCADVLDLARRSGSPPAASRAQTLAAALHLRRGAIRDAEADARAALRLRRDAIGDAQADARTAPRLGEDRSARIWLIALGTLVEALTELGELGAAEAALMDRGLAGALPEQFLMMWVLQARGTLRLAQDRADDALAEFGEVRRREAGWRPWNPAMFAYRTGLATAHLRRGEADEARRLAAEELELARRFGAARAVGTALRTLGMATGGEEGLRSLEAAADAHAAAGAELERARTLVELGAARRRAGHRVASREPLRDGLELAHRLGAVPLAERAREELLATGARPRRIMRSGVDALTPSELRVARMAAAGMTNREIAQALFVAPRTIEVHLTHTFQKLDLTSRQSLAAALATAR